MGHDARRTLRICRRASLAVLPGIALTVATRAIRGAVALALVGLSACGMASGRSGLVSSGASVNPAVLATIPIGGYGGDVAVSADGARTYVPLRTGKVVAIDTASRQVVATIATNGQPYAMALTPDGARGYATDMTAQYVLALDTTNNRVIQSIPVGIIARPILTPAVAVSRDGTRAYVTAATVNDDRLFVIDTATNTIVGDQVLPIHPAGVAVSPDGRQVYVAGCKLACIDGTFLVVDAASTSVVSQTPLPAAPDGVVLAPDGSRAYMPNGLDATVGVIDLATKTVTRIAVDAQPIGIAVDPRGSFVYVTSFAMASVSVIDTRSAAVVRKIAVNQGPRAIAVSPDGRFGYVTHSSPTCSVIDLGRVPGGS